MLDPTIHEDHRQAKLPSPLARTENGKFLRILNMRRLFRAYVDFKFARRQTPRAFCVNSAMCGRMSRV